MLSVSTDGQTSYTFHSTGETRSFTHHINCNSKMSFTRYKATTGLVPWVPEVFLACGGNFTVFAEVSLLQWFLFSYTVNSLITTTSRKRPPFVSDHFTNNPFVSQSNTVSKTLSKATTTYISKATATTFGARNLIYSFVFCFR